MNFNLYDKIDLVSQTKKNCLSKHINLSFFSRYSFENYKNNNKNLLFKIVNLKF